MQEVYDKADVLRAEILNSKTEIQKSDSFIPGETYSGTAYYISDNGSDSNDGLSPDTAFAIQGGPNLHDGTVYVRSNIFAMSEGTVIIMPQLNEYMKVFDNNTYIQSKAGIGITVNWENRYSLEDNVAALMGDESANIILVE